MLQDLSRTNQVFPESLRRVKTQTPLSSVKNSQLQVQILLPGLCRVMYNTIHNMYTTSRRTRIGLIVFLKLVIITDDYQRSNNHQYTLAFFLRNKYKPTTAQNKKEYGPKKSRRCLSLRHFLSLNPTLIYLWANNFCGIVIRNGLIKITEKLDIYVAGKLSHRQKARLPIDLSNGMSRGLVLAIQMRFLSTGCSKSNV